MQREMSGSQGLTRDDDGNAPIVPTFTTRVPTMNDQFSNLLEKLTGRAKQKAGELLEADDLENLHDEKRQEADRQKAEQIARAAR